MDCEWMTGRDGSGIVRPAGRSGMHNTKMEMEMGKDRFVHKYKDSSGMKVGKLT